MKKYKQLKENNIVYNFLDLPGTNYFKFEIVNNMGSTIEKYYKNKYGKEIYGLSHLVEHLSFKSPKDYSSEELMTILNTEGTYNASTNYDKINYWFKTTSENAENAIKIVCNIAFNNLSKITLEEFDIEKKVVLNEIKMYNDDNQTMFFFDSLPELCGYEYADTVLGTVDIINNVTLQDAINLKDIFLQNDDVVYNITYDSKIISQEEILQFIKNEKNSHIILNQIDACIIADYMSYIKYPKNGEFKIKNNSKQSIIRLDFDIVFNGIISRACNEYLLRYSTFSLDNIIREKHGLTYSVNLYDYKHEDKIITTFNADVSKGDEDLLISLFKESLDKTIEFWNEDNFNEFKKVRKLKEQMSLFDINNFNGWHNISNINENIFYKIKHILEKDLDKGYIAIDNMITFEKMTEHLKRLKFAFDNNLYSKSMSSEYE